MVRVGLLWELLHVTGARRSMCLLVVVFNIHIVKYLALVRIMVLMGVHTIKMFILQLAVLTTLPQISLVVIINKG